MSFNLILFCNSYCILETVFVSDSKQSHSILEHYQCELKDEFKVKQNFQILTKNLLVWIKIAFILKSNLIIHTFFFKKMSSKVYIKYKWKRYFYSVDKIEAYLKITHHHTPTCCEACGKLYIPLSSTMILIVGHGRSYYTYRKWPDCSI